MRSHTPPLPPETVAAFEFVEELVKAKKYDYPAENACGWGYLWHGHAMRAAFEAGAKWARLSSSESDASTRSHPWEKTNLPAEPTRAMLDAWSEEMRGYATHHPSTQWPGLHYSDSEALMVNAYQAMLSAAPQVPHGVCRADDPNREAKGIGSGDTAAHRPIARGVAPSESDDSAGTRIPAVAAQAGCIGLHEHLLDKYSEALRLARDAGFVVHERDDPNSPVGFHGQAHEDAFIKLVSLARSATRATSWPTLKHAYENYTFKELWELGQSLTKPAVADSEGVSK